MRHGVPVKEKKAPYDRGQLAAMFTAAAAEALAEADVNAQFNVALDFCEQYGLAAHEFTPVLTALRQQKSGVTADLIRLWVRDAPAALRPVASSHEDTTINAALLAHAGTTAWQHGDLVTWLAEWVVLLNQEFFANALPIPVISIERARRRRLGWYRPGRDGTGLRYHLSLNELTLTTNRARTLLVLAHEIVHAWEEVVHQRQNGGRYHTKRFQDKAKEIGIPTDEVGQALGINPTSPFAALLAQRGIRLDEPDMPLVRGELASPRSSLQKWFCGCTAIWAASGVKVDGQCRRCGGGWERYAG